MIPAVEIKSEWFRCVSLRRNPLSGEDARLTGGRLNAAGEPTLYLASTPALAVAESLQLGSRFGVERFPPRLLVTVEVTLTRVADLREELVRSGLGITAADLASDWRSEGAASTTQLLGSRLTDMGFAGAIYSSMVEQGSANLVIFVCNVDPEKAVRVVGSG